MLLGIYRLLFVPLLLLASPYYLWRMRKRGGYRDQFTNRFGAGASLPEKISGRRRAWLQAVSVGEVLAIGPVLEALVQDPSVEVYLTTTTSTGHRLALERHGDKVMRVDYFPIDWWLFSVRAWRRVNPDLVILAEGERWPEHLAQARRRGVPAICINARLSDRSFRRMKGLRAWVPSLFGGVTRLLTVSEQDAFRFREIGFTAERIEVTGNLKLDVSIPRLSEAERLRWREALGLGGDSMVVLGSSTWPGEEEALLEAWRRLRAKGTAFRLLLVPRHAERRGEIEKLLEDAGVNHHFRSKGDASGEVEVAVADTTGELRALTQLADVVFVGKSLPPHHEGQTPVEAAVLGKPVVFGPQLTNFRAIANELVEAGAARVVADAATLALAVEELLLKPMDRMKMGAAAQVWHEQNRGAVARTVAVIREELDSKRK